MGAWNKEETKRFSIRTEILISQEDFTIYLEIGLARMKAGPFSDMLPYVPLMAGWFSVCTSLSENSSACIFKLK